MFFLLKSGMKLPAIGLGTYPLQGEKAVDTFRIAYRLGYKLFDSATAYKNHIELANAFQTQR